MFQKKATCSCMWCICAMQFLTESRHKINRYVPYIATEYVTILITSMPQAYRNAMTAGILKRKLVHTPST